MTLEFVQPGDPLSAAQQNLLIDQVNCLARPGATKEAQFGTAGIAFLDPPAARLALFELTGLVVYPQTSDAPTGYFDREPTPSASALLVWCHQHQAEDQVPGGGPVRSYSTTDGSPETTIWFPLTRRDANGYGVGPPVAQPGDRVLCLYNRQSGRWEAVQGPPFYMACWGKLDEQLNSGSLATVSLWWGSGDSGLNVTAYDWLLLGGTSLPAQAKVKVEFFPQDNVWWVTGAECS
jgi:hypothetical protein